MPTTSSCGSRSASSVRARRSTTPSSSAAHRVSAEDTLLEPVKRGVGPWNWSEISPCQMLGRFDGLAKSVVVRVSEHARDLGDVIGSRSTTTARHTSLHRQTSSALMKQIFREHPVFNVMGVIITTNHKTDGIYVPPDDRRHFVAWSERTKDDFDDAYWADLWGWYEAGGCGHVIAFLKSLDLFAFHPKAPPPKTPAFHAIVASNSAPEDAELRDILELLSNPDAVTVSVIANRARGKAWRASPPDLEDRKGRRAIPHKLERSDTFPSGILTPRTATFGCSGAGRPSTPASLRPPIRSGRRGRLAHRRHATGSIGDDASVR